MNENDDIVQRFFWSRPTVFPFLDIKARGANRNGRREYVRVSAADVLPGKRGEESHFPVGCCYRLRVARAPIVVCLLRRTYSILHRSI